MNIIDINYYPYLYAIVYIFDDNQNGNALFNMHDNNWKLINSILYQNMYYSIL